ncbi:MAG TPA: ABC transporter permease [Lacipirellulaceae bacterium]|nr:ABC transporter permease [Lacipirellulaceae bacterium]
MIDSIFRILALIRKELLAVLKDPRARFTILVPPMMQCLIFGYAASFDLNDVPYAVLNQDGGASSYDVLARLDGSGIFRRVADLNRQSDIATVINDRVALLVIQFPQDFERRILNGQGANLQVIADGRNSNTAGTATLYVGTVVNSFNSDWLRAHAGQLQSQPQTGPVVQIEARAWFNPNLETRWMMIPSLIGTLALMQTMLLTAMSVAREREQGTFDQLLVTPFRATEIMAGKAIPSIMIGTVQATSVLLIAQLWFHIPFAGSFATLYAGLSIFLAAAVGIGLFLSSLVATMQQAMLFSFVAILPFSLLSGLTTPIANMPMVLQYFTYLNPLRYAIEITQRVYLESATLEQLIPDLWPLAVIAVGMLTAASWMFSRRLA